MTFSRFFFKLSLTKNQESTSLDIIWKTIDHSKYFLLFCYQTTTFYYFPWLSLQKLKFHKLFKLQHKQKTWEHTSKGPYWIISARAATPVTANWKIIGKLTYNFNIYWVVHRERQGEESEWVKPNTDIATLQTPDLRLELQINHLQSLMWLS